MRDQLRPVLAAVLALVFPGLGHLVLRRWGRALLWHVTIVGGGVALLTLYDVDASGSVTAPTEAAAALPTDVALPIALLSVLSAADAYLVGRAAVAERKRSDATAAAIRRRASSADDDGPSVGSPVDALTSADGEPLQVECPSCGKETDAELDFCHWCTEPLPWDDAESVTPD
ncbi:DUF6677 family protein [Halorubrum sp. AD140]|uniref:DUF7575 domain-containing protein n=1 Tax=Halorubrum sp. AD140 TaxID=3050073 RepID=UPI002ACC3F48|nr:DUF6677 family protein [Halorubrum sp. AD140]MDZ5812370.1 DUF6677 family protein [Halorubrum sp. AD140]